MCYLINTEGRGVDLLTFSKSPLAHSPGLVLRKVKTLLVKVLSGLLGKIVAYLYGLTNG